jgi:hypothetical protein
MRKVPQRRGYLKNGNPPGDPGTAPRCGAKTRRGNACEAPAMPNGRCRLHGGKSTGPRTAEGFERCRKANWKHGRYCKEALAERKRVSELERSSAQLLAELLASQPVSDHAATKSDTCCPPSKAA